MIKCSLKMLCPLIFMHHVLCILHGALDVTKHILGEFTYEIITLIE